MRQLSSLIVPGGYLCQSISWRACSFAIRALAFLLALGWGPRVYGQQKGEYRLEPVVVTAGRIPTTLSDLSRNVVVISREDIQSAPVQSVQDLLAYTAGVDLRPRGPQGIQADVSIRGASFNQTLVLIDGMKVNDPQTGHHNLDLPLTLEDIDRIEILKGQGSRLYGPDAFGGVINIITTRARKKMTLGVVVGDHGFVSGSASLAYPWKKVGNGLSVTRAASDGFRDDTDFDKFKLFYRLGLQTASGELGLGYGQSDKEFGADSFYSDLFPNEWEHTKTRFLTGHGSFGGSGLMVSSRLYWREHKDDFVLDRDRPEWFRNRHTTDLYGLELESIIAAGRRGSLACGGEVLHDSIASDNLGDHSRTTGGLFLEYRLRLGRLTVVPGVNFHHYSEWGWKSWPGIDAGCQLTRQTRLYAAVGRSFRIPSYTELFYDSPANKGNPELTYEKAWTYEAGVKFGGRSLAGSLGFFRREGRNLIDWVRASPSDPWQARNISSIDTNGLELRVTLTPRAELPLSRIQAAYTFIDAEKKTMGFESKYVANYLKHHFVLDVRHRLPWQSRAAWKLQWKERAGGESYLLVDGKISRSFKKLQFFIQAHNIFNTSYWEVKGVRQPGRWFFAGLRLGLL